MTDMISYGALFEETAMTETQSVTFERHPLFPDDSYAFLEYYCPDPACDCQMVMIGVLSKKLARLVARITYLFNPEDEIEGEPNPNLDYGEQDIGAKQLLAWFTHYLQEDPAYRDRLKRHYNQVKEAAATPDHPAHLKYLKWKAVQQPEEEEKIIRIIEVPSPRKKPSAGKPSSIPIAMRPRYSEIVEMTDRFCGEHLNDEYRSLCQKMAAALARKRPSPLSGGKTSVWAAGIVYALCQINFAFDKSQNPHIRPDDVGAGFDVRPATASQKAASIRKTLKTYAAPAEWVLPSQIDTNPRVWQISVDGFPLDARYAPLEFQIEAYREGLIPYIPGIKK